MALAAAAAAAEGYARRVAGALRGEPHPGDGVPGDWVTGDRLLDVTLMPLLWAVGFVLLRRALRLAVFEPAGRRVMAGRIKKAEARRWDKAKRAEWMRKWNESCWKCAIYVVSTVAALAVSAFCCACVCACACKHTRRHACGGGV